MSGCMRGAGGRPTYAGVPSGSYNFRVSTTANGEWTEAARWEFSVAPPFYRTPGFITLFVLGIALILAAAWWMRLRAVRSQYALVFAERARVSREIHDTLLQSLAAIGVELETIATELDPAQSPAREGLRRLRRQVGHCLREARESILELRNNSMKPRALVDSLRELAENTTKSKGIRVEFSTTGRPRSSSADTDMQLLRIAQESVNNAVRHGQASQVRITLSFEDDRAVLTVTDDGRGFEPERSRSGARGRRAPRTAHHAGARRPRPWANGHHQQPRPRHDDRDVGAAGGGVAPWARAIRVLCVDDHRLMREGIARIVGVQPDMTVVAQASDGEEAVAQFLRYRPDVTLMDLEMPTMGGVQAIHAIRHHQPDARIVVLTMYHGDEDIHRAIVAGAVGYLLKDTLPDDLIRVIRDVHAGMRAIPPEIAAVLEQRASQATLTSRELQVLELLATGKRNKEIAAALGISGDTASAHIKSIFQKFNVHDRTAALGEALRRGIIQFDELTIDD